MAVCADSGSEGAALAMYATPSMKAAQDCSVSFSSSGSTRPGDMTALSSVGSRSSKAP